MIINKEKFTRISDQLVLLIGYDCFIIFIIYGYDCLIFYYLDHDYTRRRRAIA